MVSKTSQWCLFIAIAACAASSAGVQTPLAIHIHSEHAMFQILAGHGRH
jgi:hypothetical protein